MSKVALFFLCFLMSTPCFASTHPRLLITESNRESFAAKITNGHSQQLFQKVRDLSVKSIPLLKKGSLNDLEFSLLVNIAFVGYVENDSAFKNAAIVATKKFLLDESLRQTWHAGHYVHGTQALAIIFDLVYHDLSEAEKAQFSNGLFGFLKTMKGGLPMGNGDVFTGPENPISPYIFLYGNNHSFKQITPIGLAALALDGESISFKDSVFTYHCASDIDYSYNALKILMEQMLPDGAYTEGMHYAVYSLDVLTMFAEALKNSFPEKNLYEYRASYNPEVRILEATISWMLGEYSLSYYGDDGLPRYDNGFGITTYVNNLYNGVDHPFFLLPLAEYFKSPDALWLYHQMCDYRFLSTGGNRSNSYLLALLKYDNSREISPPTKKPYIFYTPGKGSYYFKSGWADTDLQWGVDWNCGVNPYTGKFNWQNDVKNRGAFFISYDNTDFITTSRSAYKSGPAQYRFPTDKLTRELNTLLIDSLAQADYIHFNSNAVLKNIVSSNSQTLIHIDLKPAYNQLIAETNDGNGGFKTITSRSDERLLQDGKPYLNPVEFYDKKFFFSRESGSIPPYFITLDEAQKDSNLHNYTLQFYRDEFIEMSGDSVLTDKVTLLKKNTSLIISNLGADSLKITSHPVDYGEPNIPISKVQISQTGKKVIFPLLYTLQNQEFEPLKMSRKSGNNGVNFGELQWNDYTDFYVLSQDTIVQHSGVEGKGRFFWWREGTIAKEISQYVLSEVNSFSVAGKPIATFSQDFYPTVAFDGENIFVSASRSDSILSCELFAPNLKKFFLNRHPIDFVQKGDYVSTNLVLKVEDESPAPEFSIVHPNPAASSVRFTLPAPHTISKIQLFSLSGELVFKKELQSAQSFELSTAAFPAGVYMYTITRDDFTTNSGILHVEK